MSYQEALEKPTERSDSTNVARAIRQQLVRRLSIHLLRAIVNPAHQVRKTHDTTKNIKSKIFGLKFYVDCRKRRGAKSSEMKSWKLADEYA
ncbi:hypothetical protein KIN20_027267 [Parelaphostrongylus tenuis]|uniref:Uncharacterized protein n=1 Tax=Parelaphostrongylus tenuis TaxID=148309 RepID=A0AAD5WDX1_PARTN|nr:hypothetical protein KIN20_027267 [Parelaphostrongylus tenuis]